MSTFIKNDDFIFEIVHDLKAPVMSMDFALKSIDRDDFLDEIYKINSHNLNYLENLLSGYLLQKGKYCPILEQVNLLKIIKEELEVLNFLIEDKKLRIIISLDKTDNGNIKTDKYLIRQVVLNLLTNAVKYAPLGGYVKIVFEKRGGALNVCFSNPLDADKENKCSSKMGLEIIKKKLKVLRGKLKVNKKQDEICYNISF